MQSRDIYCSSTSFYLQKHMLHTCESTELSSVNASTHRGKAEGSLAPPNELAQGKLAK